MMPRGTAYHWDRAVAGQGPHPRSPVTPQHTPSMSVRAHGQCSKPCAGVSLGMLRAQGLPGAGGQEARGSLPEAASSCTADWALGSRDALTSPSPSFLARERSGWEVG